MLKNKFILDWNKKIILCKGLKTIPLAELGKYNWTVYCLAKDFPYAQINLPAFDHSYPVQIKNKQINFGKAVIKPLPRGSEENNWEGYGGQALKKCFELCSDFVSEHPSLDKKVFEAIGGWIYPPRFINLQQGTFSNVYQIDIKSCHANIMQNYSLPYGESQHITDCKLIENKLQAGFSGFVRFFVKHEAKIKNNQIPFIPDFNNDIQSKIKGRLLLHTRLFKVFKKQYKIIGKIIYTDFWIFEEKKGCVDKFLGYCNKLKKSPLTKKKGKMLANAFYGAIGKSDFHGYNYRAWTLAINHLAILQTYFLYRQFKPEDVLAIRSDCIYVKGKLSKGKLRKQSQYHLEQYKKVTFEGENSLFIHDKKELKSFASNQLRKELEKQLAEKLN